MNIEIMTDKLKDIFIKAIMLTKELNNPELSSEHLYKVLFEDEDIINYLSDLNINHKELINKNNEYLNHISTTNDNAEPSLNYYVNNAYNEAYKLMQDNGDSFMSLFIFFICLLNNDSLVSKDLNKIIKLSKNDLLSKEKERRGDTKMQDKTQENNLNPLEKYGRNLVDDVRAGKIDPVIGRDEEIRRVIEILSRKTKNNPVLIGEPGVGKTAIVEGLAWRIYK